MRIFRYAKTALASGVALAAATALLGSPQPASAVSSCFYSTTVGSPATDAVRLPGVGTDFGTQGLNSSYDPVCGGSLKWNISNNTIRPELTGDLIQRNNIGVNARVLVSYYDVHNTKLGPNYTDGAHRATTNLDTFHVSINAYTNPLIYRADVKTQVEILGVWTDVATMSAYMGSSTKAADAATITSNGEDFGGAGGLSGGAPINPGSIWWDLGGNQLRAKYLGTLYFTNQPGVTARLHMKTFDVHGTQLQDWPMPPRTQTTASGTQSYVQNYGSANNAYIYKAQVWLEVLIDPANNTWQQVGSTVTAYI